MIKTLIKDDYLTYLDILEGARFDVFFTKTGGIYKRRRNLPADVDADKVTYSERMFAELLMRFFENMMNDDFILLLEVLFQAEVNFYFNLFFSRKLQRKAEDNERINAMEGSETRVEKLPEFLAIRFVNVLSMTKVQHARIPVFGFEGIVVHGLCNLKLDPSFLKFIEKVKKLFFSAVMNYVEWSAINKGQLTKEELAKKIEKARKGFQFLSETKFSRPYS